MAKYFSGKLSHGFVSIYTNQLIMTVASGLFSMFTAVFMYEVFDNNIKGVFIYWMLANVVYAFLVAVGAKYLNKVGLRRSMRIGVVFGALHYMTFFFIDRSDHSWSLALSNPLFWLVALSFVTLLINRMLYWVPYHTDVAKFTNKSNRGRQLSVIGATSIGIGAIMPIIAGWIIYNYSYDVMFFLGSIIYLLSLIPLITIPRTKEKYSWSYKRTWEEFLSKDRRKLVLAFMADGAEGVVGVLIWPVFIWLLLDGNYFQVGALSSLIVFVSVFMQLIIGKYTDSMDKNKVLKYSSIFYATGWLFKIFIATSFQIFIASTYHNLAKLFTRTALDTLNYEKAADQGHYIDEYTVIHEMAIQFGKVIMYIFALFLLLVFNASLQWTFVLAAIASVLINMITQDANIHITKNRVELNNVIKKI